MLYWILSQSLLQLTFIFLFAAFSFAEGNSAFAYEETNASVGLVMTTDPRPPIYRTFSLGKESKQSLRSFYGSYADRGDRKPHALVMSNDWAAGRELDPLMNKLSKNHSIDTFYYGASFAFRKIEFKRRWPDLDKDALKKITEAIDGVLDPEPEKK